MVAIGLLDLPYGFYMLLRLALCGAAVVFALEATRREWPFATWALIGLALLYNPIFPIRIGDKGVWIGVNVLTIAGFWTIAAVHRGGAAAVPLKPQAGKTLPPPRTHAELVTAREMLQRALRVSDHQPRAMLVGLPVKTQCMSCKQLFGHVTGTLPMLENQNGGKGFLCSSCLAQWNEMRRELGLFPFAHTD